MIQNLEWLAISSRPHLNLIPIQVEVGATFPGLLFPLLQIALGGDEKSLILILIVLKSSEMARM